MEIQEQAKKLLPIIQAIAEGKELEYSFNGVTWLDETKADFELETICHDIIAGSVDYRIKPEEVKPIFTNKIEDYTPVEEKHYRPFKDCDELIKCYTKRAQIPTIGDKWFRPEIWVKEKISGIENLIIALDRDIESIGGCCVFIQDVWIDMGELLLNFTFLDNSPCGCLEYKGDNAMEEKDYDVTKDKGRITVRNVIDDPDVRKELNPDAEKLDKENGIEE